MKNTQPHHQRQQEPSAITVPNTSKRSQNLKQQKQQQSSTRKAHHHTGSTQPQHQTNGTDFRYTVEFSKNGHTPAAAFRPPWGQPCKHYRVRLAESTCPAPSPTATGRAGAQWRTPRGGPPWDRRPPARRTVAARLAEQYGEPTGVSNRLPVATFRQPSGRRRAPAAMVVFAAHRPRGRHADDQLSRRGPPAVTDLRRPTGRRRCRCPRGVRPSGSVTPGTRPRSGPAEG